MKKILYIAFVLLLGACAPKEKKRITIFYTADEHGWMVESQKADGAAAMMQLWKDKEGYTLEADSFLVLSGGDMWTGASVSTLFKGQSMFQVMQAMGYDAAALGNHEFDFSRDTILARTQRSTFPFLAANVRNDKGDVACFVKPWHIIERNGVKVGLLGLANTETPNTTSASAVENLTFTSYDETLRAFVPQMREAGAELIVVLGHICKEEMFSLVELASAMNIPLITGGHCHMQVLESKDSVLMIESEPYFRSYVKVVLEYDQATKTSKVLSSEIVKNTSETRDERIAALVKQWEIEANKSLDVNIGYSQTGIARNSDMMRQMVVDAWLQEMPDADLAVTNTGGIRQDIEQGELLVGDILGLLPFNNELLKLKVSGAELNDFIARLASLSETYIWAGLSPNSKYEEDESYVLVTTDFLYALTETHFDTYDPSPYYSGLLYRDPVLRYIEALQSSKEKPLEQLLD